MLKRYILSKMTLLHIFQNWQIKIVMLGWYVCCTQLAMLPQTIQEIAPIWLHLQWPKHGKHTKSTCDHVFISNTFQYVVLILTTYVFYSLHTC